MHSDDESTAPIPIVPARRSRWSPGRTALVATIVVLLLGAVSVLVWPVFVRPAAAPASGGEVYRESTGNPGRDPFDSSVVAGNPPGTKSQTPIGAAPGTVPMIPGDVPALYGGSRNEHVCDRQKLATFLDQHPDKAAAWAGVLGVDTSDIATYIGTLTPLQLRADTRVTNHGFVDGHATSLQSVLQAGTVVLADDHGRPRVKCGCGNPLLDPVATPVTPAYTGDTWPGFSPDNVSAVGPAKLQVQRFVVYDLRTGDTFFRPRGTDGDQDEPTTPPVVTTPPAPTSSPPPSVVTCPSGTHLSGTVCVANASPVPTRVTCQDGSHPSDNGTSCVRDAPDCRSGTHLDDGKCVEDGPHCGPNTHPDGSRCVDDGPQCKSGSHLEGSACVTDECPSGTHRIDGGETTCIPIPCSGEAHSTGDGDRPCGGPPCRPGTHPVNNGVDCAVNPCPPNTDRVTGDGPCRPIPCPTNTQHFSSEGGSPCGGPCPPGTHPVSDGTACAPDPCPSGTHRIGNSTSCVKNPPIVCPPGSHPAGEGSCAKNPPTVCPPGTRQASENSCVRVPPSCPAGTHLVNGTTCAKNIPTCPAGTHLVNGATCAKNIPTCPAGTHLVNGTTCAPNTATTARRSPPTANAAGGSDGAAVTHRVPCLLPNGRQGALNRATGTCVPLQ